MPYEPRDWIEFCGRQLVSGLTANDALRKLTKNPNLIGAYAEFSIREFIRRFVAPLKLSTGSIVYEGNAGGDVHQLDAIIWHPCPLPPILEAGEFAVVPRSAGLAYLEIKRGNYNSRVGEAIASCLQRENELVPIWKEIEPIDPPIPRTLGVVCLYTKGVNDETLDSLIRDQRVAVILTRTSESEDFTPYAEGIVLLVNFLMGVRRRSSLLDGNIYLNLPDRKDALAPQVPPSQTSSTSSGQLPAATDYIPPSPSGVRLPKFGRNVGDA